MKYRVIKRTEADGQTWYYPQYKKCFLWWMFTYYQYVCYGQYALKKVRRFKDIESAFVFIDNQPCVDICVDRYKDACKTVDMVESEVFRFDIYKDTTAEDVNKFLKSIGKSYIYTAYDETLVSNGKAGIVIYKGFANQFRLLELEPLEILLCNGDHLYKVPSWFFTEINNEIYRIVNHKK
jgi:hypothetical protein